MKVIVVGCGRIGAELAYNLYRRGHRVSVIDENQSSFDTLPSDFEGRMHEGDALNQDVLVRAGIDECDALAVVTNYDPLNAAVGHIARTIFKVPNVVVRNYDPRVRELFEAFNLQVISSTSWGAQRLEEIMTDPDMRSVFSAGNGEVEVYELYIPVNWESKKLKDLVNNSECKCLAITKAGRAFMPTEDMLLEAGDIVTVAGTMDGIMATRKRLLGEKVG